MRNLLLCALLFPTTGLAADWVNIGQSSDEFWSVDVGSIRQKVGYLQAWLSTTTFNPKADGGAHVERMLFRFNCNDEMMGGAALVKYADLQGQKLVNSESTDYPRMEPVVPGTIGESALKFVCAYSAGEEWALKQVEDDHAAQAAADAAAAAANAAADVERAERDDEALDAAEKAAGIHKKRGK